MYTDLKMETGLVVAVAVAAHNIDDALVTRRVPVFRGRGFRHLDCGVVPEVELKRGGAGGRGL